ncbi:MAG TPA: NAD(P)H-hydrate dehydratase [Candidatus Limnocylindria bacterium]|nr:NAD(P)H-hydrate dehydratase [Candidatus Limnocylindria bacterium]
MALVSTITPGWVASRLPPRPARAHKGDFGRVLVVGGSIDYPGAPLLVGLGAMRAGAGLVRVAAADAVVGHIAGSVPELTWLSLDEEAPGLIAPGGWRRIATEASHVDALVIGPGLGRQPATLRRVRQLIPTLRRPAVIDADGLTALSETDRWWRGLSPSLVLTPHPGEFARLTGRSAPDSDDDEARAEAAAEAAASWGLTVVLKGANTVVAVPDGTVLRSPVASPALATAGSGDILAGVIGALLAGGADPLAAAVCGVAIHGGAGLLAEQRIGRTGVVARDIAALLPEVIEGLRSQPAS